MELRQMKYFIEVARHEHVTKAAEKLHVAQSAVSRQIAKLEEELGVELFVRKGRNVQLTPIGKIFLKRIQTAAEEIDQAILDVQEYLDDGSGEVRIGFPHTLASYTMPSVVSAFRAEYPDVKFQLTQGTVMQMMEHMMEGELDIAFVSPVPTDHPDIEGHVFFTEEMLAILPAEHPLAGHKSIRLKRLKDEPFVMFRPGFIMRKIVVDACEQAGFEPQIAFEGEDSVAVRGMVAAGLGVGILPSVSLAGKSSGRVAHVKISEPPITRTVGFITPRARELTPNEKLFQDFLWDYFHKNN